MPTYHFRCPKGHDTDRFYKTMSGAPAQLECPECGEVATRQLSGGAGLLFKGSGFYLTDYGKNAHRTSAPGNKSDTKTDAPKSESKSDSKPVKAETSSKSDSKPSAGPADAGAPRGPSTRSKPKSE